MSERPIVLDADIYDYLELSALVEGGIGGGTFFVTPDGRLSNFIYGGVNLCPVCAHGHLLIEGTVVTPDGPRLSIYGGVNGSAASAALRHAGVSYVANDAAVAAINRRRGRDASARVTFKAWRKQLNVVRGEHKYVGEFPSQSLVGNPASPQFGQPVSTGEERSNA